MDKIKIILIVAMVIVVGGLGYWLISPLFITREVHEDIQELMRIAEPKVIQSGTFVGADNFHRATGEVKLLRVGEKYYVRFENDFTVTNGPDLFIHFGKDGQYAAAARISDLKGNVGSQNYAVPADINPLEYNELWIWCRAFSVPFGTAKLINSR